MKRSGVADLPLHGGRVPAWLATRMTTLGTAIAESIIAHYGRSAFLSRLSDPFWFQAYGSGHGHGLALLRHHHVGDGRAEARRSTSGPVSSACMSAAAVAGTRGTRPLNSSGSPTRRASTATRWCARAASPRASTTTRSHDGFQIYLHAFVLSADGEWAVVQQGMNEGTRLARRYHWHSPAVRDFVADPHTAIVGASQGTIRNLVDRRAGPAQDALLTIAREDPARTHRRRAAARDAGASRRPREDVNAKRLGAVLALAHERELRDFASFLLLEQLGPRTLQSLALIAEVVHGAPTRFEDPARFAFAHGGKDGHPFPVPLKVYDDSLGVLRRALAASRVGHSEKLHGMKRLDALTRAVEAGRDPFADVDGRSRTNARSPVAWRPDGVRRRAAVAFRAPAGPHHGARSRHRARTTGSVSALLTHLSSAIPTTEHICGVRDDRGRNERSPSGR